MTVAYLINQYPRTSHSFIRREIAALEAQGVTVQRFALRRPASDLVDAADAAEVARTRCVLAVGGLRLVWAGVRVAAARPAAFFGALRLAVRVGRRSERGLLVHLIYVAEACQLFLWLRRSGAEHVHAHFGTNSTTVAMLVAALGGPPYSFTVHGPEEFDKPLAIALGEKIRRCRFAVAVSQFGRSQLYRWCPPADWSKIHVVHCGVDGTFLNGQSSAVPENLRLVCVGRLSEQKGHAILLQAAARLATQQVNFELVIVGDGPLRQELQRQCHQLGLDANVRFTGALDNENVRNQMLAARALVVSSFAEGLPVVVMEALALGRPVLATFVGGIPELVEDGVCGWLVPAGDVDRLAQSLRQILQINTDRLTQMGRAGQKHVRNQFDAAVEAAQLGTLFKNDKVETFV